MGARYGTLWTDPQRMDEVWDPKTQPWLVECYDLTAEEFATGLRLDLERNSEFPPNAAKFRAMAISERPSREPAHQPVRRDRLLERERDDSKGLAAIEQAKHMLATGETTPQHDAELAKLRAQFERRFPHAYRNGVA